MREGKRSGGGAVVRYGIHGLSVLNKALNNTCTYDDLRDDQRTQTDGIDDATIRYSSGTPALLLLPPGSDASGDDAQPERDERTH